MVAMLLHYGPVGEIAEAERLAANNPGGIDESKEADYAAFRFQQNAVMIRRRGPLFLEEAAIVVAGEVRVVEVRQEARVDLIEVLGEGFAYSHLRRRGHGSAA